MKQKFQATNMLRVTETSDEPSMSTHALSRRKTLAQVLNILKNSSWCYLQMKIWGTGSYVAPGLTRHCVKTTAGSWVWCCTPAMPALKSLRQEDHWLWDQGQPGDPGTSYSVRKEMRSGRASPTGEPYFLVRTCPGQGMWLLHSSGYEPLKRSGGREISVCAVTGHAP